jgi:hypothetical protein
MVLQRLYISIDEGMVAEIDPELGFPFAYATHWQQPSSEIRKGISYNKTSATSPAEASFAAYRDIDHSW